MKISIISASHRINSESKKISDFLENNLLKLNNIINKITKKWKMNYKIILTGGYANLFKKIIKRKSIVDQDITIKGVSRVYREFL